MRQKQVLFVIVLAFLAFTVLEQTFLYYKIDKLQKSPMRKTTARAVGRIDFCINHPPVLNHNCSDSALHNINYFCLVNATDQDPDSTLFFNSFFLSSETLFNITSDGKINFTPSGEQVSNHSYQIRVYDATGCSNNYDSGNFDLEIICGNNPPVLNNTCNSSSYEDRLYNCTVNATDPENSSLTFYSWFNNSDNVSLFNITSNGLIKFTPNQTHIGNYSYMIKVYDTDTCNNYYEKNYTLQVINTNDAPIFNGTIPNQTWQQDSTLGAFVDLDDYFSDPDGDTLIYTHSLPAYIRVEVNSNNEVSLIPTQSYYGTQYITFIAYDPNDLNATSNDIKLTITQKQPDQPEQDQDSGGGGGGGGIPSCIPEWYCKPWGECMPDNTQTRICFDMHECNTTYNKPNITQACNFVHTCYDGIKGPEEQGIDCGGICPPCASCYDEIKNQGEQGVDCGGPCAPCKKISDKNKTSHDLKQERPGKVIQKKTRNTVLILILIVLLALTTLIYRHMTQLKELYLSLIKRLKRRKKKSKMLIKPKYEMTLMEKLAKFQKKIPNTSGKILIEEFSGIVREYFKILLNLEHEATYHEIKKHVKIKKIDDSIKDVLLKFIKSITKIEYGGKITSKTEIYTLVSEFIEIIKLTSISYEPAEKRIEPGKNFLKRVKKRKQIDRIFLKISEAYILMRQSKLNKAYDIYLELLKDFEILKGKEKQNVHEFIKRLYKEIKLARKKIKNEHTNKEKQKTGENNKKS
ncbi:hypothetical protein GF327_00920 [Candidatus Woesearchaeota archaeon]|nr:hypothetical protein [Candidatus Woesearchaeota archaeon]